jgi:hypothetical protein
VRHDDGDGPNAKEATNMEVLIGVAPHKATNVVAAIDEQGEWYISRDTTTLSAPKRHFRKKRVLLIRGACSLCERP